MKDLENPMYRQPQMDDDYKETLNTTETVNVNNDALRFEDVKPENQPEKTWDSPLGQMAREESTSQGYAQPEAEPRPDMPNTGTPQPMGTPDEATPQTQEPTIIQNPAAEYNSQEDENDEMSSEDLEEETIEHSEQGNMNDMKGYNEPQAKETEYYK